MSDIAVVQRLLHKCHKDGCEALAEFSVRLHLRCPMPGGVAREVSTECTIKCCAKHQSDVPAYVLSEQNREIIATSLMDAGYHEPDFLSARFEYMPILGDPIEVDTALHSCCRAGCSAPARWQIVQHFRKIGQRKSDKRRADLTTNFFVCVKHADGLKAADLIAHPDDYRTTREALVRSGMRAPDMHNGALSFVPVDEAKQ